MNDQHRATDSEWHCIKVRGCGSKADVVAYSTIHELLCRIEALEATQRAVAHPSTNRIHLGLGDTPQNGSIDLSHLSEAEREKILKLLTNPGRFEVLEVAQPAKLDSSLVERVADAIVTKATSAGIVDDRPARAAIRAVAAWLGEQKGYGYGWAIRLEQEAER